MDFTNNIIVSFLEELEKSSAPLKSKKLTGMIPGALIAAGTLGVGGSAVYTKLESDRRKKEGDQLLKKMVPKIHTPLGESYDIMKDIKKAEERLGMPIRVIDVTRMDNDFAKKYTGMNAIQLHEELRDNAAALWESAESEKESRRRARTWTGRFRKDSDYGKNFRSPSIIVSPSTSRPAVLHELGHLLDAHERVSKGKRTTREIASKMGEESIPINPILADEIAAWRKAKELDPSFPIDEAKKLMIKSYKKALDQDKRDQIADAVLISSIGALLGGGALSKILKR